MSPVRIQQEGYADESDGGYTWKQRQVAVLDLEDWRELTRFIQDMFDCGVESPSGRLYICTFAPEEVITRLKEIMSDEP